MGKILVNNCFTIGIFIHDEEAIMTVLEEVMLNFRELKANRGQDLSDR